MIIAIETVAFGLAWWLGLYLIARDPLKLLLRRAGLGLLGYALALACDLLRAMAPPEHAGALGHLHWLLVLLPPLCWSGALILLLPEDLALRARLDQLWRWVVLPLTALVLLGGAPLGLTLQLSAGTVSAGPAYLIVAGLLLLLLLLNLGLLLRTRVAGQARQALGLLLAATLFFGLSLALWVAPLGWMPREWVLPAMGVDLALLGLAVALLDAFEEGEALRLDIARSCVAASLAALLFGGQAALGLIIGGPSMLLSALLLGVVATAILVQTCADPLQGLLDRLVFAETPHVREVRAELRDSASALPRVATAPPPLDPAELARLTRRALSHYGDLPRLSTSPLTQLPLITARLAARGAPDQPLERAAELRALLAESIARLKPRGPEPFGTGDAWRHYNALYFPYVVGLRPYSRRSADPIDAPAEQALEWFRTLVPERTLHNWQNAAARLVAADLSAQVGSWAPQAAYQPDGA